MATIRPFSGRSTPLDTGGCLSPRLNACAISRNENSFAESAAATSRSTQWRDPGTRGESIRSVFPHMDSAKASRRRDHFFDPHALREGNEFSSENRISIPDQILWRFPWKRFSNLLLPSTLRSDDPSRWSASHGGGHATRRWRQTAPGRSQSAQWRNPSRPFALFYVICQEGPPGLRRRIPALAQRDSHTVDGATSIPSLSSSPWMRGAPHKKLAWHICWIKSRIAAARGLVFPDGGASSRSNSPANALRCQRTTVSGFTMCSQCRQSGQKRDNQIHSSSRSDCRRRRRRGALCWRTAIWWRRATISACWAERVLNVVVTRVRRAMKNGLIVERWWSHERSENLHFQSGLCFSVSTGDTHRVDLVGRDSDL